MFKNVGDFVELQENGDLYPSSSTCKDDIPKKAVGKEVNFGHVVLDLLPEGGGYNSADSDVVRDEERCLIRGKH